MISGPVFKAVNFLRNLRMDAISSSVTFYIRLQRYNRDKHSGLLSISFWKMKRCEYDPWSLRMNHTTKRDKNLKIYFVQIVHFLAKIKFSFIHRIIFSARCQNLRILRFLRIRFNRRVLRRGQCLFPDPSLPLLFGQLPVSQHPVPLFVAEGCVWRLLTLPMLKFLKWNKKYDQSFNRANDNWPNCQGP